MTTKRFPLAAAAVLLATVLGAGVSLAQENQAPAPKAPAPQQAPDQGMMGRGGMMGSGGMMGQMDPAQMKRMMESCNRNMETMKHSSSGASPSHG